MTRSWDNRRGPDTPTSMQQLALERTRPALHLTIRCKAPAAITLNTSPLRSRSADTES